jgi:arginine/lysine/ornithine decarboxylase
MSLLREGSPRYVIYCYGQALKPAPNSLVTGGTYFGMCTNYQVVAESAARAVVRVDGAGTPTPHVVVESFNPLPPD